MNMKTCSILMRFGVRQLPQAVDLLSSVIDRTCSKPKCRSCRVERDVTDETLIHYTETWDSDDAFQRHLHSPEFWRVLLTMDLCCEEPEISIGDLSNRQGMDVLRELRRTQQHPTEKGLLRSNTGDGDMP
jgi:quinol monooxygenase YgiN